MTSPEEKLNEFIHTIRELDNLLQKFNEATEADAEQDIKEKIEKSLRAMKNNIQDANALLAKQQEIDEAKFHQQMTEIFGTEQADELWKIKGWNSKRVLRDLVSALILEPEIRKRIEDRGVNLEEIFKLTSNMLPNSENAVVDIRKLRDYCLNPEHPSGKDKARLFSSTLGMTAENAEELRQIILEKVKTQEVSLNRYDQYGQRYTLDFTLEWQNRTATIRTGWIMEDGSDVPRLTSCYPLV
ncbi:MAG: DUF6883 domain-containing protein [Trichormus sp.]